MHYSETPAPPPLDRWVRCFWFLEAEGGGIQPVVPDGRLEIVLHRADPFSEVLPDGSVQRQDAVMVSGQITRPVVLAPGATADIIGIRFRTAGARDLLRIPLSELTNQVIPLCAVEAGLAVALEAAARSPEPVPALAAILLARMRPTRATTSGLAVARLAAGDRIADLARLLNVSPRTLERRVEADTGLTPKVLQRVMRFRTLYALLQTGQDAWARAALKAGYYDQAHANRDFRQFAGASPSEHFAQSPELAQAILSHAD
jgi:AraC-like DNA-binding protein